MLQHNHKTTDSDTTLNRKRKDTHTHQVVSARTENTLDETKKVEKQNMKMY